MKITLTLIAALLLGGYVAESSVTMIRDKVWPTSPPCPSREHVLEVDELVLKAGVGIGCSVAWYRIIDGKAAIFIAGWDRMDDFEMYWDDPLPEFLAEYSQFVFLDIPIEEWKSKWAKGGSW